MTIAGCTYYNSDESRFNLNNINIVYHIYIYILCDDIIYAPHIK